MPRSYTGDIEGKFWFAIQSSEDATHFGGVHKYLNEEGDVCDPEDSPIEIYSHFNITHLHEIRNELDYCDQQLGELKPIIQNLLKSEFGFYDSDTFIQTHFGSLGYTTFSSIKPKLKVYARMSLGEKILECVKTTGECNFNAEL